uniref:Secreted protein n=1 Tax=Glossina palpalis gambiensis TaxID=67801 RepID=A0A1B0AZQ4_9MUSC
MLQFPLWMLLFLRSVFVLPQLRHNSTSSSLLSNNNGIELFLLLRADVDAVETGMLVGNRYSLFLLTCVDVVVNVVTVIPILSVDEYVSVVVAVVFVVNDDIEGLVIVVNGLSRCILRDSHGHFLLPLDSLLCDMGRHSYTFHTFHHGGWCIACVG